MSITSPPRAESPTDAEVVQSPSTATPSPAHYPITPTEPAAAVPETLPPPRRRSGGIVAGIILITLGVVALFGTWFPAGGAWLFLGLGVAFLIARVLTGHPGYAVPAGILLGFGTFVWSTETGMLSGSGSGGLFFIFLGLGFLASYAIAARPQAIWPVIPAIVLIGFGAFVQAATFGAPFSQFWWLAQYWPVSLVAIGAWLLLRDRLPEETRTPVAIIGAGALIVIGLLVAAAGMASVATPYARPAMPMPWMPFGAPPIQDTITLNAPASGVDAVRLVNTSGSTVVRSSAGSEVTVQATRHYWDGAQAPDVALVPNGGALVVQSSGIEFGSRPAYIDYIVDVPATLGADVRSASGSVAVSGLAGPVRIETSSGAIDARNLTGDLRLSTTSGSVYATGFNRLSDAHSTSGSVDLTGTFTTEARVASTSGSVAVRFGPSSAVHVDASSLSGSVNASGLGLSRSVNELHGVSGDLGGGGPTVIVRTTSGSIQLLRGF